jgi:glycosyltransferase involved in cell wall biosynthesis
MVALTKVLFGIRQPVILHDHFGAIERDQRIPWWFGPSGRWLLTAYVGVSDQLSEWALKAGIQKAKIRTLGNCIDLDRILMAQALNLRTEFGLSAGVKVGLVVAGIRPDKGIDVLIDAMALRKTESEITILVVGGDADKEYADFCRGKVERLGLKSVIKFVGTRSDVVQLMRGADFAVMPSRSESGPLVLIEYMAAGLPFVSTYSGNIAHRAKQMGLEEFVDPGDPIKLRLGLDKLLQENEQQTRQRVESGRVVALQEFSIIRTRKEWQEIYETVGRCNLR